ncbi:hypothetical protein J7T55_006326 [Diaporthe amygdali]|uniref:uncharacterized protein n=1 Tax=Phomopsis amygdali TaxID=1214568 RepID=UPI0022FEC62C|nr:uncharacterized protein J7T55_006326 [Diaporthe amygdali]KAJ0124983.1 hypothetical protein J7T55_006326 [Diaporthe amygdali]
MSGFEIELPSSPDPLGDESIVIAPGSVAPPPPSTTRRPFQSAASSRFSAIPGTSPRKRMFALDVGSEITPQTIYVTVEAGPDGNPITKPGGTGRGGANVRRLLFGSPTPQPSPRRGARTTTTTIPLRGLTDDEGDPTPKRRRRSSGRPGTPATAGAKRKKKSTPTPKAARKPRGTPVASSDALQSEAPATGAKPTPARRGRPPKRKAEAAPSDQNTYVPPEASTTKKQGRKRQKSIQADDTDELTTAGIDVEPQSYEPPPSQNTDTLQDILPEEGPGDGDDDEDPFLAQLSDPPRDGHDAHPYSMSERAMESSEPAGETRFEQRHHQLQDQGPLPGESDDYAPMMDFDDRSDLGSHHSVPPSETAQVEHGAQELEDQGPLPGESDDYAPAMDREGGSDVPSHHSETTPRAARPVRHDPMELEDQGPLPGESDDFAPMMDFDDRSDVESQHSFQPARSEDATDNTVDPDTFTMIGIETMPSFQRTRGASTSDLPEIGETTSLFINRTIESLRQEIVATDEENEENEENEEVDLLGSREQTPAAAEPHRPFEISSGKKRSSPRRRSQTPQSRATQSPENTSNRPRAGLSREYAGPEPLQSKQSPAQPIEEEGIKTIAALSSDELNADDDSFSDIPEEAFAAAETQEIPDPARSSSEDELSMAVEATQEAAPDAAYDHETVPGDSQNSDLSERAQSPPDRLGRSQIDDGEFLQRSASRSAQFGRRSSQATQKSSPPHPIRSCSDSNRLLTPPDEPTSSSDQSIAPDNQPHEEEIADIDPEEEIGSSPPEITTFDREDEEPAQSSRRSSDTPANRPPSIHLQPVQAREANAAVFPSQAAGPRPFLSPIVRVGERLQNILSDPPSPSARSSVLGSPFKGSIRKSSPLDGPSDEEVVHRDTSSNTTLQNPPAQTESLAESPRVSWAQSLFSLSHLKSLVTEGARKMASPQTNITQTWEDPFGPSSPTKDRGGNARNSAFMDRIRQASREGSVHSSRASIARATLGDADDRSFSGDPAPRGLGSNWKSERSLKPSQSTSSVLFGRQGAGISNAYDGAADEEPEAMTIDRLPDEPRTDDTLLQPVEDQAPETGGVQYPLLRNEASQEEEILVRSQQDEMQLDEAPLEGDGSDEDDVWAIEADRTASSPTAQRRANESINESFNAFARSGLSIDWGTRSTISQTLPPGRSPAFKQSIRGTAQDVPENLEDYSLLDLHSGASTQPSAKKPTPEAQKQPQRVDLSDFFSSSPNFIERERRARTASKAEAIVQNSSENDAAPVASPAMLHDNQDALSRQRRLSSDSRLSDELPSPAPGAGQRFGQDATEQLSSTSTPERPRLTQQRLAPRQAQNDAALFENWEVSSSRAPTERLYLTDPISDAQPSSPQAIERPSTPVDRQESSPEAPILKPLPGRNMSPAKSCLRSPLKPKTPGRVVEFTSSTLSPMAQGQARAAAQSNIPTTLGHPPSLSPRRSPRGKENKPSALKSYISSSPHHRHLDLTQQQQEQSANSPLSQTKWSKRHWLLMDGLLQAYRGNALDFQLRHSGAVMASPKKRASSSLLGKMVTSQGEKMALEQWHLDIVDAFKKEVGGWPEDALAKRLFSLIVGEERRKAGLVPRRR